MSSLADRLRGVIRPHGEGPPAVCAEASAASESRRGEPAELLGGEWRELSGQRFLVIDRKYPPGHRHGHVAVADTLPPEQAWWPRFPLLDGATTPATSRAGRMLFLDLETTGLAGGAGTYAFLVGCAWYESGSLRVRQFFLSSFAAERALLAAVAQAADRCGAVVTFNGKSFDLPLMETRFVLHRLETPFAGMTHVDMLHPARRLWRQEHAQDGGARLSVLEQVLCGHDREGDVPGFEIPSRYFHYVRTGDAHGLSAVMEHNRLDLLSLAVLTARASQLLEDGPEAARTAREALGMGRLYERAGMNDEARASFARAANSDADSTMRAEAWRAFAVLSRRERRFDDAASAWRRIVDMPRCPAALRREASEALAIHHEHRVRDLRTARTFALQSLRLNATPSRSEATRHRLARLNRKLGDTASLYPALF